MLTFLESSSVSCCVAGTPPLLSDVASNPQLSFNFTLSNFLVVEFFFCSFKVEESKKENIGSQLSLLICQRCPALTLDSEKTTLTDIGAPKVKTLFDSRASDTIKFVELKKFVTSPALAAVGLELEVEFFETTLL